MWINRTHKLAFIANPRTGSREVGYELLRYRGFDRFLGHHGVPWGSQYPRPPGYEMQGDIHWWFTQNPLEWSFYATHRNHFEVFHSISYAALRGKPPSPERFEYYLWRHPGLYRNVGALFPSFFEVADCRVLRFDHLRDDVDALLREHGLPPLRDDEGHRKDAKHRTAKKPPGEHYRDHLDPLCREWIEERYHVEMSRFGYTWDEKKPAA